MISQKAVNTNVKMYKLKYLFFFFKLPEFLEKSFKLNQWEEMVKLGQTCGAGQAFFTSMFWHGSECVCVCALQFLVWLQFS